MHACNLRIIKRTDFIINWYLIIYRPKWFTKPSNPASILTHLLISIKTRLTTLWLNVELLHCEYQIIVQEYCDVKYLGAKVLIYIHGAHAIHIYISLSLSLYIYVVNTHLLRMYISIDILRILHRQHKSDLNWPNKQWI